MIFILSGPSGSGKTTLRDLLLKDRALGKIFVKSVSLTTRPKRSAEKEGRDYFFTNESTFASLRKKKRILEWTRYLGYYYGTKKDSLEGILSRRKHVLLCLDFKGTKRVKKLYPEDTLTIFIIPPSIKELRKRIEKRSTGIKEEEVIRRISRAKEELKHAGQYDFSVKNINLVQAVKRLKGIILKRLLNKSSIRTKWMVRCALLGKE